MASEDHLRRAAYLPEDKTLWGALIEKAAYVVTQDSGFNWMALTAKPSSQVMTVFTAKYAEEWRIPGQPYSTWNPNHARLPATDPYFPDREVYEWIKAQNEALDCNRRLHAVQ